MELFHRALDELLGVVELLEDKGDVHLWLAGEPITPTVDTMLADQRERIGQQVERDREASPGEAHHRLVDFQRV